MRRSITVCLFLASSAAPLFLGERRIEMQHKGIRICSKLGDDEWDLLNHLTGDESDVTGKPIELGNDYRALCLSRLGEGGCKLWAPIQSVRAFSSLYLGELLDDGDTFNVGEAGDGCALRLDAKSRSPLALGGDPIVGYRAVMR